MYLSGFPKFIYFPWMDTRVHHIYFIKAYEFESCQGFDFVREVQQKFECTFIVYLTIITGMPIFQTFQEMLNVHIETQCVQSKGRQGVV